jgi:hypothetical protein
MDASTMLASVELARHKSANSRTSEKLHLAGSPYCDIEKWLPIITLAGIKVE